MTFTAQSIMKKMELLGRKVDGEDEVSCEDARWSAWALQRFQIQIQLLIKSGSTGETRSEPINSWISAK